MGEITNYDIFDYNIIVCNSLSLIACFFLLTMMIIIKDFSLLSYRLIAYLCLIDMITSIGNFYSAFLLPSSNEGFCYIQAFLINFGLLASILLTSVIIHFLDWLIVKDRPQSKRLELGYLLFVLGTALLLSIVPFVLEYYNYEEWICWIEGDNKNLKILLQIGENYLVMMMVFVYNVITLVKIYKKLKNIDFDESFDEVLKKKLMNRLIYYPTVLFICITPTGLHRIVFDYRNHDNVYIKILATDLLGLIGLANCIVYGFTYSLKKKIKNKLKQLINS